MPAQRYEDPDGRWAMAVPPGWVSRAGSAETDFLVTAPVARWRRHRDRDVDRLTVAVMAGVTPQQLIEQWRAEAAAGQTSLVAERYTALGGLPAREIVIEHASGRKARRRRLVCCYTAGATYSVVHTAAMMRFDAEERLVDAALDTFELPARPEPSAHRGEGAGQYTSGSSSVVAPRPAGIRRSWVAGCVVLLIALSLLAFALIREARHTGEFSRGGRPGIFAGGCITDVTERYFFQIFDTHCDGPVYDPTGRKYLGDASFRSFVRAGRHDVVRVRVIDAHDRSNLLVRPDAAIDTLGYAILISTCAAVALGAAIAVALELRKSAKRYRVGKVLFRVAAGGLAASLLVSHAFHLPTAAASVAPVTDPVVSSDGSVNPGARVFASAHAAHYYRVVGHTPDTAQACGQVSGCAHGIAFIMIDSAGDLIAAGWRLRLTDGGAIDQAISAVRAGRHPGLPNVSAAAIHPYPVPPNRSADVVGSPGTREGLLGRPSHAPFHSGAHSYWSAQQVGISTDGDEIIVVALARTDGGRLTHGAREAAVLQDLRIILRGG